MMKNIDELNEYIGRANKFISKEMGKKEIIEQQINIKTERLQDIGKEVELLSKVSTLLHKTSEYAREQAKFQVETLVTKCLQYVFETDIKFIVEIEEQRSKSAAEFYVVNNIDDHILKTKPELSRGGGVVDIVSLALRIAFLQTHKPKIQGPLILDEPAKHVSDEYIYNVSEFLKQTSELFDRQIIMVTHNNHLSSISTSAYKVDLKSSISEVTKISSS